MADDEHEVNGDSDEPQQKPEDPSQKKSAKHDSGAADLERVTDYAEEKEIFSTDEFKGVSTPLCKVIHNSYLDTDSKFIQFYDLVTASVTNCVLHYCRMYARISVNIFVELMFRQTWSYS